MIVLEGRAALVTALAYAPDGRTLALGGSDGRVGLWDPFAGQQRLACVPLRAGGHVSSVAFSADGKFVAAGLSGEVVVWSASSGHVLHWHRLSAEETFSPHPTLVAFHPTEERLAIAHAFQDVIEVDPLSDRRFRSFQCTLFQFSSRAPNPWRCLAYLGSEPVAGFLDHLIVWRPSTDGSFSAFGLHWATGPFVALSHDLTGRRLAGARERGVAVWELPEAFKVQRRWRTFKVDDRVNAVALTPDGRTLLAGGDDWTVHVWDVESRQKRCDFNWRLGPVTSLVLAPDGMTAAVTGRKGAQVLIWDLE
jgi:WD40 repeat protein